MKPFIPEYTTTKVVKLQGCPNCGHDLMRLYKIHESEELEILCDRCYHFTPIETFYD